MTGSLSFSGARNKARAALGKSRERSHEMCVTLAGGWLICGGQSEVMRINIVDWLMMMMMMMIYEKGQLWGWRPMSHRVT